MLSTQRTAARTASSKLLTTFFTPSPRCAAASAYTLSQTHPRDSHSTAATAQAMPHRPAMPTTTTKAQPQNLRLLSVYYDSPWPHPVYTQAQMDDIKIAHRSTRTWSDWTALLAVRTLRWGFDLFTGYRHDKAVALGRKDPAAASQRYAMTEEKWTTRFIFLESIAGVPGMVGGMVRHLHSLRCLRRDMGWIETLLEESQNERMHLLTFLKFAPGGGAGWFMRACILGAQGVFTNLFFMAYLVSPRTCHRFVGYLEEEAVITYTRAIADLEAGKLPKWENMRAPDIARDYFKLEPGKDGVRELLHVIRADEAKHREVNHTLANLEQARDVNPYVARWEGEGPRPTKGLETVRSTGWERSEVSEMGMK
ncbi:putative alternative oxidase [Geopyxis carbonaria]|nr:putative alternative oxidase [Geopyxis carbonaria]